VECDRSAQLVVNLDADKLARVRQQRCEAQAKWRKDHAGKWNAICAEHWASKLQATPAWANRGSIAAIYAEADRLTKETGEPWHVDHVVPLRSKLVCGLHVEANLRVMPGTENMKKGNRHWPGSNGWLLPAGALPATPAAAAGIACWERDRGRAAPWVAVPRDRPL